MKADLKDPKPVSAEQADFLRTERPPNTYGFYDGKERYKLADKLPTASQRAVENGTGCLWLLCQMAQV